MNDPLLNPTSLANIPSQHLVSTPVSSQESNEQIPKKNGVTKDDPSIPKIKSTSSEVLQQISDQNIEDHGQHKACKKEELTKPLEDLSERVSTVAEEEDLFGEEEALPEEFELRSNEESSKTDEESAQIKEEENVKSKLSESSVEDVSAQNEDVNLNEENVQSHEDDKEGLRNLKDVSKENRPDLSDLEKRVKKDEVEIIRVATQQANGIPIGVALKAKTPSLPPTPKTGPSSTDIDKVDEAIVKTADKLTSSITSLAYEKLKKAAAAINADVSKSKVNFAVNEVLKRHNIDKDKEKITEDDLDKILDDIFSACRESGAIFKKNSKEPISDKDWELLESTFKESFKAELLKQGLLIEAFKVEKEDDEEEIQESDQRQEHVAVDGREQARKAEALRNAQKQGVSASEEILKNRVKLLEVIQSQERGIQKAREAEKQYKKFLDRLEKEERIIKKDNEKHAQNVDRVLKEGSKVIAPEGIKVKLKVVQFDINNSGKDKVGPTKDKVEDVVRIKTFYSTNVVRG